MKPSRTAGASPDRRDLSDAIATQCCGLPVVREIPIKPPDAIERMMRGLQPAGNAMVEALHEVGVIKPLMVLSIPRQGLRFPCCIALALA